MSKIQQTLLAYSYMDSQRLKNTFFAAPKKSRSKKKIILFALGGIALAAIITAAGFFLLTKYEVILVKRHLPLPEKGLSLLKGDNGSSLELLGLEEKLTAERPSFIHLLIGAKKKTGLKINLNPPLDLDRGDLFVYLKGEAPLRIEVVVKDTRFFSNWRRPLRIGVDQATSHYAKIPIKLEAAELGNVNLSKIKQINLYFYSGNEEQKRALIKDVVLIKEREET